MKKRWRWIVIGIIGLAALIAFRNVMGYGAYVLMQRYSPTLSPDLALLFQVQLQAQDLPPGWYWADTQIEEVPGGEGRFSWFWHISARNRPWVNISETVLVYPDEAVAQEGYQTQLSTYYPPGSTRWREMSELEFLHHADERKTACLEAYINEYHHFACSYIARYGRVVIVVLGNVFDQQWLTMPEFREVLIAADRRAAQATGRLRPPEEPMGTDH